MTAISQSFWRAYLLRAAAEKRVIQQRTDAVAVDPTRIEIGRRGRERGCSIEFSFLHADVLERQRSSEILHQVIDSLRGARRRKRPFPPPHRVGCGCRVV